MKDQRIRGKAPELAKLVPLKPGVHPLGVREHNAYRAEELFEGWFLLKPYTMNKHWNTNPGDIILFHQPSGDRFKVELLK